MSVMCGSLMLKSAFLFVFFTIKNLQHVKLSLGVKTFKGYCDIVSFLHCNTPRTHLEVRVAFWPARA